jgi:hypothetical protein
MEVLFAKADEFEELTLFLLCSAEGKKDAINDSGNVLRNLTEFKIRKICGEVVYRAAMQGYSKISEKKFADNTLSGIMDARGKDPREIQFFRPEITLEGKNSRKIRAYGKCECKLGIEGNLCPHMAALMIAWARGPREFDEDPEYMKSKFEKGKHEVMSSLEELLILFENSSRAEDFDLLQKIYSRMEHWTNAVGESNRSSWLVKNFDPRREFSGTINYLLLSIVSEMERKYPKLEAIETYNRATLTTLGKVLELFVENTRYERKSPLSNKERKTLGETARSWDQLIENFAKE